MPFPISYKGKLSHYEEECNELYVNSLLDEIRSNLERAGAVDIRQKNSRITFRGPLVSFRFWDMKGIDYGEVTVDCKAGNLTVSYLVSYLVLSVFVTLASFGFLGTMLVVVSKVNLWVGILVSTFAWAYLYGMNVAVSFSKFKRCLKE